MNGTDSKRFNKQFGSKRKIAAQDILFMTKKTVMIKLEKSRGLKLQPGQSVIISCNRKVNTKFKYLTGKIHFT